MAHTERMLAEVFPPGEFIQEELDARGWLQTDFAEILGVDKKTVSEIIAGKRSITPEMAVLIGEAFGTGPTVWLNLDSEYQIHKTTIGKPRSDLVARKAKLYSKYPVREMAKRGWIRQTSDIDALEAELNSFYSPGELSFAARRSEDTSKETLQIAWLYRAYHMAAQLSAPPYSEARFHQAMGELKSLLAEPKGLAQIPHILSKAGVRFLLVEALPTSKIDGVCFWLDKKCPVVALSARLDRIDNFWFTLMHELHHVKYGHGQDHAMLDVDIMDRTGDLSEAEKIADQGATEFLIPENEIDAFIADVAPFFSVARVSEFAEKSGVHPGIVVGRLQYQGALDYNQHRKHLTKVRALVASATLHDGWGAVACLKRP